MKRLLILLLAGVLAASALSACTSLPGRGKKADPTDTPLPTYVPSSKAAKSDDAKQDPEVASSTARDEVKDDPSAVVISDYVKNAKENVVVLPGGGEKRFRIPEILIDSSDARAANSEIMTKYGSYFDDPDSHNYVISMDYDAYLYDNVLSIYIKSSVDGGNSSGLCYCFDITSGSELDNKSLCTMSDHDYNTALSTLKTNLTAYYDDKYSNLPGNDEMRSQTLADSNIKASKMFLDGAHKLTAVVDIYAAVGGGRWVDTISAE